MEKGQRRQGDIYFLPIEECPIALIKPEIGQIPDDCQEQNDGIIAHGEVTGHHHRISDTSKAALLVAAGVAYIQMMAVTKAVHDEHGPIDIPQDYRCLRQGEYTPQGWRQVAD